MIKTGKKTSGFQIKKKSSLLELILPFENGDLQKKGKVWYLPRVWLFRLCFTELISVWPMKIWYPYVIAAFAGETQNALKLWHVSRLRGVVGRSVVLTTDVIARRAVLSPKRCYL